MIIGFTGTRKGMAERQSDQFAFMLGCFFVGPQIRAQAKNVLHQGGAYGADKQARIIARQMGFEIEWHPCPGVSLKDVIEDEPLAKFEKWHEVFPPLHRNRNLVAAVDVLVAAPFTNKEELRAGTWATVRYAREKVIPIVMLSRGAK